MSAASPPTGLGTVALSVVVPASCGEERLGAVLDRLRAQLDDRLGTGRGGWEVIVVDDGSIDATADVVRAAAAADPRIRLIRDDRHQGRDAAVRRGVAAAVGRRVLVTDTDLAAATDTARFGGADTDTDTHTDTDTDTDTPTDTALRPGSVAEVAPPERRRWRRWRRWPRSGRGGVVVAGLYLLAALLLYGGLWADLGGGYLADAMQDQNQWEWFFAVTADNISHLRNPLFTDLQGMPDGVNLMGNTVMLGLSVPLTPVTLALGPTFTLALVFTLGIAATAFAWYWLIRRRLGVGRRAAAAGGALAAFAPPMIAHAPAHPNFVVLFVLPLIVDRALRLCTGRAVVRDGIVLGLFAAYQVYIGEEALLLAALGMLLFALCYAAFDPGRARVAWKPLVRGLFVAAAVTVPLVAFPLWWQFSGPQSYHSVPHPAGAANSPRALIEYAGHSLFGDKETAARLSMNHTEQNAFYGWPLIAFSVAVAVWLWRRATAVRALAVTALAAAVLSLGSAIPVPRTDLVVPGPWRLLAAVPLFEFVIEGRVAMICAPALGMLLALALDRILRLRAGQQRTLGLLAVAAALLPVLPVPVPLAVRDRDPVPEFITSGAWKPYVKDGEALVPVPLPDAGAADALHWQVTADFGFRLAGGYFMGPWGPDRIGTFGATPRHLSNVLREVRYGGDPPPLGPEWQEQARRDLAYWKAGAVVLPDQDRAEELRALLTSLLGAEPERVRDVWVWRVGPTTG
ncbi:glycosyltransferase [Streptomyces sp. WAC06614]|uniref:glycosyltransferase n=1 Tax=Streptomyces sp. WAC06614 TaxID=2487416 RepID=UPI000F7A9722|nr:glycosyltransferase [Streptomyces sp. WAC06614]RSS79254.1 glycosyltransferase [Streptomyces sp. WAC06614]